MLVSSAGALVRVDLAEIVVHCDFQKRFVGIPLRVGILWVMYSKLGFWRSMFNKTLRRLLPDALPLSATLNAAAHINNCGRLFVWPSSELCSARDSVVWGYPTRPPPPPPERGK